MKDRYAPEPTSLSHVCEHLGLPKLNEAGAVIDYAKSHYCLGHLELLLSLLKRRDRHSKGVFTKLCRWKVASCHLIPIIRTYPQDRSLMAASVNLLSILTKPIERSRFGHNENLSDVMVNMPSAVPMILRHLSDTLDLVQGKWELQDDWEFVQSLILLIPNMLCNEEYCLLHDLPKDDGLLLGLSDSFLENIFVKNLMDEMLVVTQHIDQLNHRDSVEVLEIRDSTFYKLVKFAMAYKTSQGHTGPLLPFPKEIMQPMLVPCCTAASVAISGFTVLAAKIAETSAAETSYLVTNARWLLAACPYFYVPLGIAGITFSAVATTQDRLLGFTSGLVLTQILYLICVVGLIGFITSSLNGFLVVYFTFLATLVCMALWGAICEYPKWLSYRVNRIYLGLNNCVSRCVIRRRAAEKAVAAGRAIADERAAAAERTAAAGRGLAAGGVAHGEPDLEAGNAADRNGTTTAFTREVNLTSEHKVL